MKVFMVDFVKQLLHGNVYDVDTEEFSHGLIVGSAGDEPVGRLAYNTDATDLQLLHSQCHLLKELDAVTDMLCVTMNDLAL